VVEAVDPAGWAVLNAADPPVTAMAEHCPGSVVFFTPNEGHPVLAAHRAAGGRVAFVRGGAVVLAEGPAEEVLVGLGEVPLACGGRVPFQVENVLAAAAAAWSLGLPSATVRSGLCSFRADPEMLPARFNVCRARDATVIVDYAHNPSAVEALVEALDAFPAVRRTAVFCPPARRDPDVVEMCELLARGFDRVLLYQDRDNHDRADGELTALLRRGLEGNGRVAEVRELPEEQQAINEAFRDLRPGDLLVIGVEAVDEALACVRAHLDGADTPPAPEEDGGHERVGLPG
jgi:cyanophycin synthetase